VSVAVGIGLVAVAGVRESLHAHGERYVNRIYTDAEQRDCRSDPRCLATRFAAKEATAKALRVGAGALPWHSIGVVQDADGRPSIRLTGEAAGLAEQRGMKFSTSA